MYYYTEFSGSTAATVQCIQNVQVELSPEMKNKNNDFFRLAVMVRMSRTGSEKDCT